MEQEDEDQLVPKTLSEAIQIAKNSLDSESLEYIKHNDSATQHHLLGRHLRNTWNLWDPANPLTRWFRHTLGITHGDDISGTILAAIWANIRNEEFDVVEHVKTYKRHWMNMGVHPIDQVPLTFDTAKELFAEIGVR